MGIFTVQVFFYYDTLTVYRIKYKLKKNYFRRVTYYFALTKMTEAKIQVCRRYCNPLKYIVNLR